MINSQKRNCNFNGFVWNNIHKILSSIIPMKMDFFSNQVSNQNDPWHQVIMADEMDFLFSWWSLVLVHLDVTGRTHLEPSWQVNTSWCTEKMVPLVSCHRGERPGKSCGEICTSEEAFADSSQA
jgi:hypothetical protein